MQTRSPRSSSERRAEIRRDEDAARRGDDTRFVEIRILPTEENLEAVRDYDGPEESLSQAEKFMRAVGKVPRYQLRVKCMLIRATFDEKVAEISESVSLVAQAVKEVRTSPALKKVLQMTLALGNYLNGGTNKGAAWGFKLDTLSKLSGTKTVDNKSTLLHYIAGLLAKEAEKGNSSGGDGEEKTTDAVLLLKQMPSLEQALRVVWVDAGADVSALRGSLKQVENAVSSDKEESFKAALGDFHSRATAEEKKLTEEHAVADKGCLDLCAWLAEEVKGGKLEPEKVFAALHTFALALEKAHAFNVEAVEKEAKKKRMEAAAKAREEEMAARKLSKASSGGSAAGKGGGPAGPAGLGGKGGARPGGPRPPGNGPPRPGFGMAGVNDELTRKLAARGNGRGNLVDGVKDGLADGSILVQKRNESFGRRASMKRSAGQGGSHGSAGEGPSKPPPPPGPPPPSPPAAAAELSSRTDRDHSPNTGASPKASPVAARSKRKGLLGGIRNRSKTG